MNHQWNGKECQTEHVNVLINDAADSSFKWWRPYLHKVMKALKVTTSYGQSFYLYDGDGSATRKVENGGGPNMSHKGFENIEETDDPVNAEYINCIEHEWSEESLAVFNTKSRYCIKCRACEFIENHMKKGGI